MHFAGLGSIFGWRLVKPHKLYIPVRAFCIGRGSTPYREPKTKKIIAGLFLRVID